LDLFTRFAQETPKFCQCPRQPPVAFVYEREKISQLFTVRRAEVEYGEEIQGAQSGVLQREEERVEGDEKEKEAGAKDCAAVPTAPPVEQLP
jgi:hypothetical protein